MATVLAGHGAVASCPRFEASARCLGTPTAFGPSWSDGDARGHCIAHRLTGSGIAGQYQMQDLK